MHCSAPHLAWKRGKQENILQREIASPHSGRMGKPCYPMPHNEPVPTSLPPAKRKLWLPGIAAVLALLIALGAFFAYRHLTAARMIRELVKHVQFEGLLTGQIENSDRLLELVRFHGALDTSDLTSPKASLKLDLDTNEMTGKAVKNISPTTDGRFLAATLGSLSISAKFFGGADLRFADENVFVHLDRTPFSRGGEDPLMALVGALAGPKIASNPWVRIPAGPAGTSETQAVWALLFRPTDQVFGNSKELHFLGREDGEDLNGIPTEIHRYTLNGKWLSQELRRILRDTLANKSMTALGVVQSLATGKNPLDAVGSLDTLTCSDGDMKVWVGKKDTLPHRIVLETKASEGKQNPLTLSLRGEINATYGTPQAIDFPAESVTLDELKKSGILRAF